MSGKGASLDPHARMPGTSDRRQQQRTDITSRSSSLELALSQNLQLEEQLKIEAEHENPIEKLRRLLSTKSAISTTSSFAERQQAAVGTDSAFREIGKGCTGIVFENPGTAWAFKASTMNRGDTLWNHYVMNLRIQESFDQLGDIGGQIEIPRVLWFANESSEFWKENRHLFPENSAFPRGPQEVLCMDRIFPLHESIRHNLIELYCPSNKIDIAKTDQANKDCLLCPLLGRKRFGSSRPGGGLFFSLRNYKLHVDQIKELDLDSKGYAVSMAKALAVLHWHTKIDAMDVEFILGSSPIDSNAIRRAMPLSAIERLAPGTSTYEYTTNSSPDFTKRIICLWLLDFHACRTIPMTTDGVRQIVKAFIESEPSCPRPSSGDPFAEELWQIFRHQYAETANRLVGDTAHSDLPGQFIEGVALELEKRKANVVDRAREQPPTDQSRGGYRGKGCGKRKGSGGQRWNPERHRGFKSPGGTSNRGDRTN